MFSPPGRSPWRSGATTFRSVPRYRCLWPRSWRLRRSSSCAMCAAAETRHDNDDGNGSSHGRPSRPYPLWQHFARPAQSTILVLLFLDTICDLFLDPAGLYVYHVAQIECGDFGSDEPVVGLPPDTFELHRPANPEPISDILPQLRNRVGLRGIDNDGGQHICRICFGTNEVLGIGYFGNRRFSDLPDTGVPA